MFSSRYSNPFSCNCIRAVEVMVFDTDASQKMVLSVIGRCRSRSR